MVLERYTQGTDRWSGLCTLAAVCLVFGAPGNQEWLPLPALTCLFPPDVDLSLHRVLPVWPPVFQHVLDFPDGSVVSRKPCFAFYPLLQHSSCVPWSHWTGMSDTGHHWGDMRPGPLVGKAQGFPENTAAETHLTVACASCQLAIRAVL